MPECPVLVGVTLNLTSGTSPILLAVGIPNLVCGYILVPHIVYRSLCLIYENLLSLGVVYQFVTQFMILPNNQLSNSAIQRYLYRWYNPFLT